MRELCIRADVAMSRFLEALFWISAPSVRIRSEDKRYFLMQANGHVVPLNAAERRYVTACLRFTLAPGHG
jgi:hypothetical protein